MTGPDRWWSLGSLGAEDARAWEQLAAECSSGYFSGPVWCTSWYDSFTPGAPNEVGVWTDGGEVVAVAPLVRIRETVVPVGARRVGVTGWQNAGAGPGGADHVGFACRSDLRDDVAAWVLDRSGTIQLLSQGPDWSDVLAARGVPVRERTRTYEVSLADGARPGSKKLWKHITRSRRQLVERGAVFDHRIGGEIDRDTLAELFALHGMRSASVGRRTTFTEARSAFHERLAARSTATNASYVVRARLDGALVGGLYGFLDDERVHYYQSGWDPGLERSSLGSILIGEAIDLALDRGASRFDFLRGDEPYKLRFGAEASVDSSFLVPRGPGGLALRGKDVASRWVPELRQRLAVRRSDAGGSGPSAGSGPSGDAAAQSEQR